jgi:hypothetical protein
MVAAASSGVGAYLTLLFPAQTTAITKALRDNYSVTAVYDLRGHDGIDDEATR